MVGYFDNSTSTCIKCPAGCLTCISLTNCTSCKVGYFLYLQKFCYLVCPVRFYFDNMALNCQACPYDCLTCDKNGFCLSCDFAVDHRVLSSSKTRCIAAVGFFDNSTTKCVICPQGCQSCSQIKLCTNCLLGYYLSPSNLCVSSC